MNRKIRSFSAVICVLILISALCGCGIDSAIDIGKDIVGDIVDIATLPSEEDLIATADNTCDKAIEAIKSKNLDSLVSLFGKENRNDELKGKLQDFIEVLQSNIDSIDSLTAAYENADKRITSYCGGGHLTNYQIVITPVPDLKNKSGDELRLYIYTCVLDEDKENIGLQSIVLTDKAYNLIASASECFEKYEPSEIPDTTVEIDIDNLVLSITREEYAQNLLYSLNNKDKALFVSLFTDETKEQADAFFDKAVAFTGALKSFSRIETDYYQKSVEYGYCDYMSGEIAIYDLINADGNRFEIAAEGEFINRENKSEQGFNVISISKVENKLSYCKRNGNSFHISHKIIDKIEIS